MQSIGVTSVKLRRSAKWLLDFLLERKLLTIPLLIFITLLGAVVTFALFNDDSERTFSVNLDSHKELGAVKGQANSDIKSDPDANPSSDSSTTPNSSDNNTAARKASSPYTPPVNQNSTETHDQPSTPPIPLSAHVPTENPSGINDPPAGFGCVMSASTIVVGMNNTSQVYTFSTNDTSRVIWRPYYHDVIWGDGTNDSPAANLWMVLDQTPSPYPYVGLRLDFRIRTADIASGTTTKVAAWMIDGSRKIATVCSANVTAL